MPGILERIASCLLDSIDEALAPLASGHPPAALFIELPNPRPGLPEALTGSIREAVERRYPGKFEDVEVSQRGHAGGAFALAAAMRRMCDRPDQACVVAGADSYCDPDTLEWLEQTDQLHGAGPRNNAWGFIPGEGAGALLVMAQTFARGRPEPLARVVGIGAAREARLIRSGTVCVGEGLTAAFRGALAGLPGDVRVTDVYCDLNGDAYRADEYAFAVSRTRERFVSASVFVAPADCWGDMGAASLPLAAALAVVAGRRGYARGAHALAWASSDSGERGAVTLGVGQRGQDGNY